MDAYVEAFSVEKNDGARVNASKLMRAQEVVDRLNELHTKGENAAVMSLAVKRRLLAGMAQADLSKPTADLLPIAQGVKYDAETGAITELKMPNKISALELDARLAGELDTESRNSVTVVLTLDQQKAILPALDGADVPELETVSEPVIDPARLRSRREE